MIIVTMVSERSRKWGLWKMARDLGGCFRISEEADPDVHLVSMKARIMLTSSLAEQ